MLLIHRKNYTHTHIYARCRILLTRMENPLNSRRKNPRTCMWTLFTTLVNAHIQTAALCYYVEVVIPEKHAILQRWPWCKTRHAVVYTTFTSNRSIQLNNDVSNSCCHSEFLPSWHVSLSYVVTDVCKLPSNICRRRCS